MQCSGIRTTSSHLEDNLFFFKTIFQTLMQYYLNLFHQFEIKQNICEEGWVNLLSSQHFFSFLN